MPQLDMLTIQHVFIYLLFIFSLFGFASYKLIELHEDKEIARKLFNQDQAKNVVEEKVHVLRNLRDSLNK